MSKRLRSIDVCADCSVADPRWASINRGVLMCDDCGSVHRSLGRHISQVRHLTHTPWPPTLLQMVQMLVANGANSIWEHTLLDPTSVSGKRKASPQDKVHPNKTEFIRAKYSMLAFVHRLPCREDDSVAAKDLSKQLHSSVRTGNLETCLRLLSLGAQANFFHPEKGNTPLHVASKGGQILQAELLAVYGADPGAPDANGKTPSDNARQAGHHELADRLVEIQYELTDRLAFFLCGRKPDHKNGQHFIIPQMAERHLSLDLSELAKAAKKKLQSLSNHLFEELAMDVYDEVDRRETDAVWLTTQNHSTLVTETTVIPFLPVNPEYSSTRNQGRQKLARFNAHEFATLVIDILSDAKRRQLGNPVTSPKDNVELVLKSINDRQGSHDNDQPDYDSVASDEDTDQEPATKANRAKSMHFDLSGGPITLQEYMEVKNALSASEAKVQQLMKVNSNLSDELRLMQKKASKLEKQNSMPDSDYDNAANNLELDETGSCRKGKPKSIGRHGENPILEADDPDVEPDSTLPSTEDVIRKTEQITKNIQELLRAAQENKHESFMPCSERIHVAVAEMAALFPKKPRSEMVRASLNLLTSSAYRLQSECKKALPAEPSPTSDIRLVTQQVIQCAYDIAKAAKQLVTIMTKENN
ncbi:ARF GTPase-activating protein GIT2 isoform X16 [Amblyraja radiata]|uniref:ARF GTPase-activating protein GIT2 isoform X16 n=1 Tax=Amblyraja radiata TaxID=386614 RepID=UPI0014032A7E|nr:ARF GTPase-activating protein GIT2 isoform X16 [Amblyraja radiata]